MADSSHTEQRNYPPVILIIDEDRDLIEAHALPLLQTGYEIRTAQQSFEARNVCALSPVPIHLVIIDIPLERFSNIEGLPASQYAAKLVTMVRQLRPTSRILLTSSTPGWKLSRQRLGAVLCHLPLLHQPCPSSELLEMITAVLAEDPRTPSPGAYPLRQCA